jgi:hypothetical protein
MCTQHRMKWLEYDAIHSNSNVIIFSPMCLSYSRVQSKCILFSILWANDKLSSTLTRTSSELSLTTWCIELRTKLIMTMKTEENPTFGNEAEQIAILVWCRMAITKVKERVLLLFKRIKRNKDGVPHPYIVKILKTKTKLFHLAIHYITCGTSFCMATNIINYTYEILSDPFLHFCTRHHVSSFVKVVCVINLQHIFDFYNIHGLSCWWWIPLPTKAHCILTCVFVCTWKKSHRQPTRMPVANVLVAYGWSHVRNGL